MCVMLPPFQIHYGSSGYSAGDYKHVNVHTHTHTGSMQTSVHTHVRTYTYMLVMASLIQLSGREGIYTTYVHILLVTPTQLLRHGLCQQYTQLAMPYTLSHWLLVDERIVVLKYSIFSRLFTGRVVGVSPTLHDCMLAQRS